MKHFEIKDYPTVELKEIPGYVKLHRQMSNVKFEINF